MSLAFALVVSLAVSQTATAPLEHRAAAWGLLTATGQLPPSQRVRLYAEVQPRFDLIAPGVDRLLLRAAIGLDLAGGFSLWLGNAWAPSFMPSYRSEARPFLQLLGEHAFGDFRLVNRFRFEERFIDNAQGISLRVRHMVRGVYLLGQSKFAIAAYDEIFFTLNHIANGPVQGFDQNRAFVGLNRRFGKVTTLEAGYLATYLWRGATLTPRLSHTLLVWLAFNFG